MRKLTPEELSRVLGQSAIGKLTHWVFSDDARKCGCVAGAVHHIGFGVTGNLSLVEAADAYRISNAVSPQVSRNYPAGPDAILRYLEELGLA